MIRIEGLSVPVSDGRSWEEIAAERLSLRRESVRRAELVRRAVDARRRHGTPVCFSCVLDVETEENEGRVLARFRRDKRISAAPEKAPSVFVRLAEKQCPAPTRRPVVVGFGPAGMFAALALSAAGCAPLVFERGQDVDARHAAIARFWSGGPLDENTNVQFGEGGAGTFSDGKLTARGGDPLQRDVLDAFVRAGAPEEIRYLAKPHIGTDRLREVVKNIRAEILRLGTSAGGQRAKAIIAYNKETGEVRSGQVDAPEGFDYYLIKLDGVSAKAGFKETENYGRLEYSFYKLVKACGIKMTECSLIEENGRAHFLTKRFDRKNGKKVHMQTLCGMAHYDYRLHRAYSYEQAFNVMRALRLPYSEAKEMFRRHGLCL